MTFIMLSDFTWNSQNLFSITVLTFITIAMSNQVDNSSITDNNTFIFSSNTNNETNESVNKEKDQDMM